MGFCPRCRVGTGLEAMPATSSRPSSAAAKVIPIGDVTGSPTAGWPIGIGEVDRVLGGGMVPGAAVLLGGEPGVGKSTLLLQAAGRLAASGRRVLIASAEESLDQIGIRAQRLGVESIGVLLTAERDVDAIVAACRSRVDLLVVDSIQTVGVDDAAGTPGGVAQVKESAARLVRFAKDSGVAVVLVGHVTKDGAVAGPKLLEHSVDVVLYLEGDPHRGLRMLRCLKNRFGPTHEVGLFEMHSRGLGEIVDPSGVLVSSDRGRASGSVVFPAVDGRRPLLVEVQALVVPSPLSQPRRSVKGIEAARVGQVLAVLEKHGGLRFGSHDVYVGVAGGLRVRDPGIDLAVALALGSSVLDRPLGPAAAWGEVGLTGEIRRVPHAEQRESEARRLGLDRVFGTNGRSPTRIETVLADAGLAG